MNATVFDIRLANEEGVGLPVRLIVAFHYAVISVAGLLAYALLLLGFRRDRKEYAKQPFYRLVYHLALSDVGILVAQFFTMPLVISGESLYGYGTFHFAISSLETLSFFSVFFTSFLMAINRFCVFTLKKSSKILFLVFGKWIWLTAIIPHLLACIVLFVTTAIDCNLWFSHRRFHDFYVCPSEMTALAATIMWLKGGMELVVPLLMFALYVAIYLMLRCSRKKRRATTTGASTRTEERVAGQQAQAERAILFQSAVICTVLEVECLLFAYVPRLDGGLLAGVFLNFCMILNSAVNPYIFLCFNSAVIVSVRKVCGVYDAGV